MLNITVFNDQKLFFRDSACRTIGIGSLAALIHTVAQSMGFIRPFIVKWKHGFKLTDFNLVL